MFTVIVANNGRVHGRLGPYTSRSQALVDAEAIAEDAAEGVQVYLQPVRHNPQDNDRPDVSFWPSVDDLLEGTYTMEDFRLSTRPEASESIGRWLGSFYREGRRDPSGEGLIPAAELPRAFYLSGMRGDPPPKLRVVLAYRYGDRPEDSAWSTNYETGEREEGVSIVGYWTEEAWETGSPPSKMMPTTPVFFMDRPKYWFFGIPSGVAGSDGEPLLLESSPLSIWS